MYLQDACSTACCASLVTLLGRILDSSIYKKILTFGCTGASNTKPCCRIVVIMLCEYV